MFDYDAIVIGSGFGGAFAAYPLVNAGWRVLMIERGAWLERGPQNWFPGSVRDLSPQYDCSTSYAVSGENTGSVGNVHCVGGASLFYGGVSLRYREGDFAPTEAERRARAQWPYEYGELEPYYAAAERIIGVAGEEGSDPSEPFRSTAYPNRLPPLSRIGRRMSDAAESIGLRPFRLPLAINYRTAAFRNACVRCSTCDCYPCAIAAKNDVATAVLPALLARGMHLVTNTAAVRLRANAHGVAVKCIEVPAGKRIEYRARHIILAAGALVTPHLLLASQLDRECPSGKLIGRLLMRHTNAVIFGIFPRRLDAAREFHKEIGINDHYFGHPAVTKPAGRLGTIQQVHCPPIGLVRNGLPRPLNDLAGKMLGHLTGFIIIAGDEPQLANRVELAAGTNRLGMPNARVHHRYSARDRAARRALLRVAADVLHAAGAPVTFSRSVQTFSHALGTVRMGADQNSAPVAEDGRLRGYENIWVADASVLPTSAAVNPSLTIAATALRTGCRLAGLAAPPAAGAETFSRMKVFNA